MNQQSRQGVSDISSEEGDLRRFSRICSLLISFKPLTPERIQIKVRNKIGLKNRKVIERHIRLLEELKILEKRQTLYIFSDIGKVFCTFLKDVDQSCSDLSSIEKLFYFERFFEPKSPTHLQLYILLETVSSNTLAPKENIIINYFRAMKEFNVWGKKVIEKNLRLYESDGKISSFFVNRFRCEQRWLEAIGLIKRKLSQLTEVGERVEKEIRRSDANFWKDLDHFSLMKAFIGELFLVSTDSIDGEMDDLVRQAFRKLSRGGKASAEALRHYLFYQLLMKHKYLDEVAFDNLLHLIVEKNIVASVVRGRDGKIKSLTLSR